MHVHIEKTFFLATKYSFFLATLNCAATVTALTHRLCIWRFEVCHVPFKQDSYDLAYTRHMHDEIDNLKITYALAKNQYGLGCIGRSGRYGPEIRHDVHVFTASMLG